MAPPSAGSQAASLPAACPASTWTATADVALSAGGCEPQGCGLNGAWLGQQVNFRELHLNGTTSNKQGLHIAAFQSSDKKPLRMNVVGDELSGELLNVTGAPVTLSGPALDGSTILLQDLHGGTYTLTIQKVIEDGAFWTECNPSAPGGCSNVPKTRLYQFSATDGTGNCVEVCKPGMADEYGTLNGTAVIFKGDLYGDDFTVRSVDGVTPNTQISASDGDVFNIACVGTALSKLYLLHHTAASAVAEPASKTTVGQRQSLLRLLAGDYCGIGHSFTQDGHPISLDYASPALRPTAKVGLDLAHSVDAMWRTDGSGASCLGTPRLSDVPGSVPAGFGSLVDYINSKCPTQLPVCAADKLNLAKAGDLGSDYAISANAFP